MEHRGEADRRVCYCLSCCPAFACNQCFIAVQPHTIGCLAGSFEACCPPAPAVAAAGEHPAQSRAGPPLRVPDIDQGQALQYLASLGVPPKLEEEVRRKEGGAGEGRFVAGQAACRGNHNRLACLPAY